jgi:hypothetical protein
MFDISLPLYMGAAGGRTRAYKPWVACCETTECQIDNALVHIDDALVRIRADIRAAL